MKYIAITGLIFAFLALIAMLIGHTGAHELSWVSNQISTYAAKAPKDRWITTSMLLACGSLVCFGMLVSKYEALGSSLFAHGVTILAGAATSGLILLTCFEETATSLSSLSKLGFSAIRQQSFHDAGLLVFFYCAIALGVVAGIASIFEVPGKTNKVLSGVSACLSPTCFLLMTGSWPRVVGIVGPAAGLKQRSALLALRLSIVMLLIVAANQPGGGDGEKQAGFRIGF
jgi:hypothetical protein